MNHNVSQVVWPWRNAAEAGSKATAAARRRRALLQGAVMAVVATLLLLVWHKYWMGIVIYGLSSIVVTTGFLAPGVFLALERAGQWLGRVVGIGLTWLLLAPFFYLCFGPARLILSLAAKDPMCRRYERNRASYWTDHKPVTDPRMYTRQY